MQVWKTRLAAGLATGLALIGLAGCVTSGRHAPAGAFDLAGALACSQARLDAADPGCLVLSDPRASRSQDRAVVIAAALVDAGYEPVMVRAEPVRPGERVLGFAAVQNRGPCAARRDCGGAFPAYVAPAVPGRDGTLLVIDPAVLDAPADPVSWASQLVLAGRSLADVQLTTMEAEIGTLAGAQAGLQAAYCRLPDRRADFAGYLALRGYDRPRQRAERCAEDS